MCYFTAREYEIVPTDTYEILRGCSGCNAREKSVYHCTGKFRINANGKLLDVWLIYQCRTCGHTCNVPIYSRIRKKDLPPEAYKALMQNETDMVARYALDRALFQRNGMKIHKELSYEIRTVRENPEGEGLRFINPYRLRLRYDKLIADCLGISRSKAKQLLDAGELKVSKLSESESVVQYRRR